MVGVRDIRKQHGTLTLPNQLASLGIYRQHSEDQRNLASDLLHIHPFQSSYRDFSKKSFL